MTTPKLFTENKIWSSATEGTDVPFGDSTLDQTSQSIPHSFISQDEESASQPPCHQHDLTNDDLRPDDLKRTNSSRPSVTYPVFTPSAIYSDPSTPPISLPITPTAISTVYGAIAMSMPGNHKNHNGDSYQRVWNEDSEGVSDEETTVALVETNSRNGLSRVGNHETEIEMPNDETDFLSGRRGAANKFPSEKKKTLVALAWFAACLCLTCVFITLAHDRYPPYETNHPLPDLLLENLKVQDWAFPCSEYCAMILSLVWYFIVVVHRHKWILLRRQFFIVGLLYLYRCVTMIVTNLPRAFNTYECAPKTDGTFPAVIVRSLRIMVSAGLSTAGELHTCGDWVFSGHTCMLVSTYLFIHEYSPRKFWWLHWICGAAAFVGVVFILLGHDHYTLDCVVAYYVCTRIFWIYHEMALSLSSRSSSRRPSSNSYLQRVLWFRLFQYLECNVKGEIPRQYGWPFPWPRSWASQQKDYE